MNRYILSIILAVSLSTVTAQKVGYVDTDYILSKLPEYGDAQNQLNAVSSEWQSQLEKRYKLIDQMYKDLQAEEILLTDDMKKKRIEEIKTKENEALEYQKKKFGVEGDLFKERKKLVMPLQEKVYKAIKEVALASGYAIMMDKAGATTLIYTNPKYNKSDAVLKKLGFNTEKESEK